MVSKRPSFLETLGEFDEARTPLFCVHGLNQQPSALKPLLGDLHLKGFQPYLMSMPGHDNDSDFKSLTPQKYHQAYQKSYFYIKNTHQRTPFFLGYSFGGLLGVCNFSQNPFEKMVLLAPALRLHGYSFLMLPILPFVDKVRSIPLKDEYEKRYRFHHKGVPAEIYQSFFKIYKENLRNEHGPINRSEALLFVHPKDELVSFKKMSKMVEGMNHWSLESLDNQEAKYNRFNHLCFDPVTLGENSYQVLLQKITAYLQN